MTETLTHYPAGADVPDWLVAVEPAAPGAVFESLKFMAPAIVADLPDRYLVFSPDMSTPPPSLHIIGGANRVYAAAKPVYLVQAIAGFLTLDVNAWTPVAEMAQQNPPPHPWPQSMQPPLNEREVIEQHQAQRAYVAEQAGYLEARKREQELAYQAAQLQQARPGLWRRLWTALKG